MEKLEGSYNKNLPSCPKGSVGCWGSIGPLLLTSSLREFTGVGTTGHTRATGHRQADTI